MKNVQIYGGKGRHIDEVDVRYAVSERNLKGRMLQEFCLEKESCVCPIHGGRERGGR